EITTRLKLAQQALVIDIETERLGSGVEIGAVNEQSHLFRSGFHDCSRVSSLKVGNRLRTRGRRLIAPGPHLRSEWSDRLPRKVRMLLVLTTNPKIQD